MSKPANCPKCGSWDIGGPIFNRDRDALKYWCRQCGWETSGPTLEQQRRQDEEKRLS